MRLEFGFQGEQHKRADNHDQRRVACRKQVQSKQSQQDRKEPDHARSDCARMVEFEKQQQQPDRKQRQSKVGIHEHRKYVLLYRHVVETNADPGQVQNGLGAIEASNGFAV